MAEKQKLALIQLQLKLIELIRELDERDMPITPISVETDDYEFRLEYSQRMKRYLVLVKDED